MKAFLCITGLVVLLMAQGCKRSEAASDSTTMNASISSSENLDKPIGCHPMDASVSQATVEVPNEMPSHQTSGMKTNDMVFIKGGRFTMGTSEGLPVEGPVHEVFVKSFWLDAHEVTVAQFADFIKATGYQTESEKLGWSGVFDVQTGVWKRVDGANWQHPEGPSSSASPKSTLAAPR